MVSDIYFSDRFIASFNSFLPGGFPFIGFLPYTFKSYLKFSIYYNFYSPARLSQEEKIAGPL